MWKDIPGWEKMYQVSTDGSVRSVDRTVPARHGPTRYRGRLLKRHGKKYPMVQFTRRDKKIHEYVHRIVTRTFIGICPDGMEVRHKNGKPWDCRLKNLIYSTRQENAADRLVHGTSRHIAKLKSLHVIMVPWCQCCECRVPIDHVCKCEI